MNDKCPCYQCNNRYIGYHPNCNDYLSWKKENSELKHRYRKILQVEAYFSGKCSMRNIQKHSH